MECRALPERRPMRKIPSLLLLGSLFVFIGCAPSITPPGTPPGFDNVLETAAHMAESTPLVEPDLTTATLETITMQDLPTEPLFRDDFDQQLSQGWFWQNEDPANWNLNKIPGALQINAVAGYVNLGNAKNVLLRPVPEGDFMAEASLLFNPDENDQFAGLILYESNRDFIQAGLGYCLPELGCKGNGVYVEIYKNGRLTLPRNMINYNDSTLVLRLIKEGNTASFFASRDGSAWYRSGQFSMEFTPNYIGLIAAQNNEILPLAATFEYFELTALQ